MGEKIMHKRTSSIAFLISVVIFSGCSSVKVVDGSVVPGIYEMNQVQSISSKDHVAGHYHIGDHWDLKTETRKVPLIKGIEFGIKYELQIKQEYVDVRQVVKYPSVGLKNPETGKTLYSSYIIQRLSPGGHTGLSTYKLNEPWEMVSGEWIFEIIVNNETLIKETVVVGEAP